MTYAHKTLWSTRAMMFALIGLTSIVVACGDDDGNGGAGGTAGVDSGIDGGGTGGSGGSGGNGGSAGMSNTDAGDDDAQVAGNGGNGGSAGGPVICEDTDNDGHTALSCGGDDCNDADANINPSATELCDNGINDDCSYATPDHPDLDGDGYNCLADCNDAVRTVHPGRVERCGNGIDDDCNAATSDLGDLDNDGFSCDVDCDETRWDINPAADELCGNGVDDDCDATTPDLGDGDNDGLRCDVDCDDSDATLPDSNYYCGDAFSYYESFEAGAGGWTVSGDNASWQLGVPTGEAIDAAVSGQRAWVTGIDPLGHNNDEASFLTSPTFNFSSMTTDPVLRFQRVIDFEPSDAVWVELSTNGGSTWNRLPPSAIDRNFYGPVNADPGFNERSPWSLAVTRLTGAAGQSDVRIRFVMFSDYDVTNEGFGLDDVRISSDIIDVSLDAVSLPAADCSDRSAEPITLSFTNVSSAPLDAIEIIVTIDNGTPIVETATGPFASGSVTQRALTQTADLSAAGPHQIRARLRLPNTSDENPLNNAADASTYTFTVVSGTDYTESFEQGAGGWVGLGIDSSWERGMPVGDLIGGAGDGQYAWVTNLYGVHNSGEESYLVSPCFDFSDIATDPVVVFQHAYALDTDGAHWLETAVDNGVFTKVGSDSSAGGLAWYNDAADDVWNDEVEARGLWHQARHPLPQTHGHARVQLRFPLNAGSGLYNGAGIDHVRIVEDLVDAQLARVEFPQIECEGRTSQVRVRLRNAGNQPLAGFRMSYQLDDQAPVIETFAGPIAPTTNPNPINYPSVTFQTPLSVTGLGAHVLRVQTLADNQVDPDGTSIELPIVLQPTIEGDGYGEDFENGPGNWITVGEGSQWEHGRPQPTFADVITTADSGEHAWVTRLYGDYGPDWTGDLASPCLDFSALNDDPLFRFAHIFESERPDPMWLESSIDGVTWTRVEATALAVGWYNETNSTTGDRQWSGRYNNLMQWHPASEQLENTAGAAFAQVRFHFAANSSNTSYEGHGIDTVSILSGLVDLAVEPLATNASRCASTAAVTANIVNRGTATVNGFSVQYRVDGGATVTEQIATSLSAGATYPFRSSALLSTGVRAITVTAVAAGDVVSNNNSASGSVTVIPSVNGSGYTETFDSNNGGWTAGGVASSWQWGTPNATFIPQASASGNAWVTNLTGNYATDELSYVASTCLDFSSFGADPTLQFSHIFTLESGYDYGRVEVSTDGGSTFEPLGAIGTGTNWYTSTDGWTGTSGSATTWRTASHTLTATAGEAAVVLRFVLQSDDSVVREGMGIDSVAILP